MKKILILSLLSFWMAPAQSDGKFQVALRFTPLVAEMGVNEGIYNGVADIEARYRLISLAVVDLNVGFAAGYISSDIEQYSDIVTLNPKIVAELKLPLTALRPYLGVGYVFYRTSFEPDAIYPTLPNPTEGVFNDDYAVNYSGVTLNPGARYYFKKLLFVDLGYNFMSTNGEGSNRKLHFITAGAGLRF